MTKWVSLFENMHTEVKVMTSLSDGDLDRIIVDVSIPPILIMKFDSLLVRIQESISWIFVCASNIDNFNSVGVHYLALDVHVDT